MLFLAFTLPLPLAAQRGRELMRRAGVRPAPGVFWTQRSQRRPDVCRGGVGLGRGVLRVDYLWGLGEDGGGAWSVSVDPAFRGWL